MGLKSYNKYPYWIAGPTTTFPYVGHLMHHHAKVHYQHNIY